ncbi:hypothetical protein C1645_823946 [Glomus cerebriforme]|uniref:Uncharacterized protein n=1 Tax=Glomus cerebriforme TaxID=658196 RepID=A0A397T4Q6_9GLOM|nr:hypothetical protein C1645_823946 [Glomus cerebriforme]
MSTNDNIVKKNTEPILDALSLIHQYYIESKTKIQSSDEEKKKLQEKIEETINLFNDPQKINEDNLLKIKLVQSKQKIEQQLETKIKEIDNLSQTIKNNAQLIESKENDIKNLEKINSNLKAETLKYQSALGAATTYLLGDNDKNNSVRLNEDIERLQDMLEDYVSNLRTKTKVNYKKVNNLFTHYHCNLTMNSHIKDLSLIKALLQRHVIEFIYRNALDYFENVKNTDESQSLESEINSNVKELINLMDKFAKSRSESDNVTSAVPIKLRQQIFAALSNHGFSDIIDDKQIKREHEFINQFKKQLNQEIESYRELLDPKKKKKIEEKATEIIREVVRLFFFRLKTQEPIAKWKWFNNNDKIDPIQMTGSWDEDDVQDTTVEICIFPLIYKDPNSSSSELQIYTQAKVVIHDNNSDSLTEENGENDEGNKNSKSKFSKFISRFSIMGRSK